MPMVRVSNGGTTLHNHFIDFTEMAAASNTFTGWEFTDGYITLERQAPVVLKLNNVVVTADNTYTDQAQYYGVYHLQNIQPSDTIWLNARVASLSYV